MSKRILLIMDWDKAVLQTKGYSVNQVTKPDGKVGLFFSNAVMNAGYSENELTEFIRRYKNLYPQSEFLEVHKTEDYTGDINNASLPILNGSPLIEKLMPVSVMA